MFRVEKKRHRTLKAEDSIENASSGLLDEAVSKLKR